MADTKTDAGALVRYWADDEIRELVNSKHAPDDALKRAAIAEGMRRAKVADEMTQAKREYGTRREEIRNAEAEELAEKERDKRRAEAVRNVAPSKDHRDYMAGMCSRLGVNAHLDGLKAYAYLLEVMCKVIADGAEMELVAMLRETPTGKAWKYTHLRDKSIVVTVDEIFPKQGKQQ